VTTLVHIFCDAPAHLPKVARIGRFGLMPPDNYGLRVPWEAFGDHVETVMVDGARIEDRTGVIGVIDSWHAHRRYRLTCPLCGTVQVFTASRLWPLLEELANDGEPSVSLRDLSAKLQ